MNKNYKEECEKILKSVSDTYYKEINGFLEKNKSAEYQNVVILMMELVCNISTIIYYGIKQLNPSHPVDFDFIKAKIINRLSDSFEDIKKFNPLTESHANEIREKGFILITDINGKEVKFTKEDLI